MSQPQPTPTTPASAETPAPEAWWKRPLPRWGRRAAAFALLLFGVYLLVWDKVGPVCHQELADNNAAVSVCAPVEATDPRVLGWVLVVIVLFLPDLSEVEIGGILKLRRAVEETKDETQALRGELAEIRTQAAALSQSASAAGAESKATIYNRIALGRSVNEFLDDVEAGETGSLSPTEERGAYAQLAFTAGLTGMIPQFFSRWQDDVYLVGWVLGEDGQFELTHLVPDAVPAGLDEAIEDQLDVRSARDGATFLLGDPSAYAVGGYAFSDPDLSGQRHLLGALGVLILPEGADPAAGQVVQAGVDPTDGFDADEIDDLRAATASAAAVYGLMLTQLLGERPTLWGLAAAGGGGQA